MRFTPGSRLAAIYGAETEEGYHCSFGLNPAYESMFEGPMKITGRDEAGEARAVELDGHPFFICTLFQPERWALEGCSNPLVAGLVNAIQQNGRSVRLNLK
jgi:CTP synthase (UTP-ammonia lyase)